MKLREIIIKKRNQKLYNRIVKLYPKLKKKQSIIDIGCGDCKLTQTFNKNLKNHTMFGLDIKNFNKTSFNNLIVYKGKKLPFLDNSFDICFLFFTLHHVDNQKKLLTEAKRITKKTLIIIEDTYYSKLQLFFLKKYDKFTNIKIAQYQGINIPYNFNTDKRWKQIFSNLNLKIFNEYTRKFPFFPFTYSFYFLNCRK